MPCESCSVQFSVFKRKRICGECDRYYCSSCLLRGGGMMCGPCRVLSTRPLGRQSLSHLKVRDLQYFLHRQNVSTRGCVEKEDLVNLAVAHVNSGAYRRRPPQQNRRSTDFNNPFISLKGITNNINNFLNTAFDIRPQTTTEPPRPPQFTQRAPPYYSQPNRYPNATQNTTTPSPTNYNAAARTEATGASTSQQQEGNSSGDTSNTTSTPTSNPVTSSGTTTSPPELIVTDTSQDGDSTPSDHRDTADCLEIEDCDDAAEWEFIRRPAEPLPPDSNVLFAENSIPEPGELTSRAASELDLRRSESIDSITETSSLKDEPIYHLTGRVQLEDLKSLGQLETLNVKQLKELLALNRVDFKGCVERKELMERAKRLWKESAKSREELNNMSADELCKICMDAPLECVLLECGHMASCTACGKRLSECPICRQYVVRVVRFFRS